MAAADRAAEQHRSGITAQMRCEVAELRKGLRVSRQFRVADLADQGRRVPAVGQPVRLLPAVEAGVRRVTSWTTSMLTSSSP